MNNKRKPIPELDNLPGPKREQLHEWVDTLGYIKTIAKLKAEWDFTITYNKLRRYWLRWLEKGDYDEVLEDELTIPQYLDLLNGRAIPYDKAGIQRIMMRAYHLIGETGQSVTRLATLLRVLHYNTSCEWTNKRIEISNRLATVREQELVLKQSRSQNQSAFRNGQSGSDSAIEDHLGPIALTLDDLEDRATRKFNLPPRTEAEKLASAHAKQSSASVTPDLRSDATPQLDEQPALSLVPNFQSGVDGNQPSSTASAVSQPAGPAETLESRVNKYTLARYHEALHGKDSSKVGRSAAFNFRSALQSCPCGKHVPCPDHGDFPHRFWEVFPDDADYIHCLESKKLPFTPIHDLLAREAEKSEEREAPDLNAK